MHKIPPCPFCGKEVNLEEPDTLHPTGIVWKDTEDGRAYGTRNTFRYIPDGQCWVLNCYVGVGCDASMGGDSKEEVIEQWSRRSK